MGNLGVVSKEMRGAIQDIAKVFEPNSIKIPITIKRHRGKVGLGENKVQYMNIKFENFSSSI